MKPSCPLCFSKQIRAFYKQNAMPVFTSVTYKTYQEAINCEKGDISLNYCQNCSFIFNSQFRLLKYDESYDTAKYFSKSSMDYINSIIDLLVNKHKIKDKQILEVGCGDGEFLKLLCKHNLKGTGIDPSYNGKEQNQDITFIKEQFNQKHYGIKADVLILRHMLEQVENPYTFLRDIIKNTAFDKELTIVIEGPDFEWISRQGSYWDINYERWIYFTRQSLTNLLRLNDVEVVDTFNVLSDQYIIAIGKFSNKSSDKKIGSEQKIMKQADNEKIIDNFIHNLENKTNKIKSAIKKMEGNFAVWGAASKGTLFINTLNPEEKKRVTFVIDINKELQGKYIAGTGHRIVPHSVLKSEDIRDIFIMNPKYYEEICSILKNYNRKFKIIKA